MVRGTTATEQPQTIRRTVITFACVVGAAGLTAQTQETKTTTKTKVEVKGGRSDRHVSERRFNGNTSRLISSRGTVDLMRYPLTSEDLSKGARARRNPRKVVANGNGKISVDQRRRPRSKTAIGTKSRTEGTSGVPRYAASGMTSMKTLSSSCN